MILDGRALIDKVAHAAVTEPLPWPNLQAQIKATIVSIVEKLDVDEQSRSKNDTYNRVLATIDKLQRPPFTIQRVCELLLCSPIDDNKQYKGLDAYLCAIDKVLQVESPCTDSTLIGGDGGHNDN